MRSNFRTPLVLPESTDLPMGIAEIEKDEGLLFLGTPAEKEGPGRRARERERERETADHRRPPTHCLPRSLRVPRSLVTSRPHKGHDALLPWLPSPHLQLLSHVRPDQVFFGSRSLLEQLLARLSYVFTYASCSLGSAADPLSLSLSLPLQHRPVVRQWSHPRLLFRGSSPLQTRSRQVYLADLRSTVRSPSLTERPFLLRRYPSD